MKRPQETFRVQCSPYEGYWVVHITENQLAMQEEVLTATGLSPADATAWCVSGSDLDDPKFRGALFFHQECLSLPVVVHELAHAVFRMLELDHGQDWSHTGITPGPSEERYARVLESMFREFTKALNTYQRVN